MDCLLADRYLVPEEHEPHFRERILRLPDCYVCYQPFVVRRKWVRCRPWRQGTSPSARSTISPRSRPRSWPFGPRSSIACPARLLLKYRGLDDPGTARRFRERFAACGITGERIEMLGWSSRLDTLECYRRADIALDPFPFSGGLTTCECSGWACRWSPGRGPCWPAVTV